VLCCCGRWIFPKKQEEKEFEAATVAFAMDVTSSSMRLPYAPRKLHLVTGLQWVEEKEQDSEDFYAMFRMRRSVFHTLHDLLVEKYGLKSTCNISSKEALAYFFMDCGYMSDHR
jgi:hypothetical protein